MALSERLQTALDELRMQMLATEVLFGFQLEGTFKEGLGHLSSAARVVDAAALTSVVLALTVMIAAPAQHRLVERGDASLRLLHATQRHAAFALLFLAIAVGGDMYVVASFYLGEAISICLSIGVFGAAIALWFLLGFWSKASVPKDMLSTNEAIPLHEKIKQMLHESWIVLPGATGIFGFQLIITMTPAFESLSRAIQVLHFIALVLIALGVIALVSPAAVHRLAFGGADAERSHMIGSRLTTFALAPLALGITADYYVATGRLLGYGSITTALTALVLLILTTAWYLYPGYLHMATQAKTPTSTVGTMA